MTLMLRGLPNFAFKLLLLVLFLNRGGFFLINFY